MTGQDYVPKDIVKMLVIGMFTALSGLAAWGAHMQQEITIAQQRIVDLQRFNSVYETVLLNALTFQRKQKDRDHRDIWELDK